MYKKQRTSGLLTCQFQISFNLLKVEPSSYVCKIDFKCPRMGLRTTPQHMSYNKDSTYVMPKTVFNNLSNIMC